MILACDNIGSIRTTSYAADHTSPTEAQFDLAMAIQYVKSPDIQYAKSPDIQWTHQDVRGRQDEIADHTLTPLELINVDMDNKAKAHWESTKHIAENERLHYFSDEPWSISLDGEKLVSDLATTIQDWCQQPRIQEKWIDKGRIPEAELAHIDYTTTAQALQSVEPSVR
jgi:hypothetical protein